MFIFIYMLSNLLSITRYIYIYIHKHTHVYISRPMSKAVANYPMESIHTHLQVIYLKMFLSTVSLTDALPISILADDPNLQVSGDSGDISKI